MREIVIGAALFPLGFVLVRWLDATLRSLGVPGPAAPVTFLHPARAAGALALTVVVTGVVAIAEETIFRGYLVLRLGQVSGSVAVAVLGSSALFAMGTATRACRGRSASARSARCTPCSTTGAGV